MLVITLKSLPELSTVQFNLFGFSILGYHGNIITFTGTVIDRQVSSFIIFEFLIKYLLTFTQYRIAV